MLTTEKLCAAGYRKFTQAPETIRGADYGLQWRVDDEKGTRYAIIIYVYDMRKYHTPERAEMPDFGFMADVQFREEGVCPTVDVSYNVEDSTTITELETFYDKMWQHLGQPYTERKE